MNQRQRAILIVEDDPLLSEVLSELLQGHHARFNVTIAYNGKEAVGLLNLNNIDLVITGLRMPKMNGEELIQHMVDNHHYIPIIVMSGLSEALEALQEKRIPSIKQFFKKPLDIKGFLRAVLEALDLEQQGP